MLLGGVRNNNSQNKSLRMNKWKSKADSLLRLAEDQKGKPEGELARQKLKEILDKHPEAKHYEPLQKFMLSDIKAMRMKGISTDGSWTGNNLQDAIAMMVLDYKQRLANHKPAIGLIDD